MRLKSLSRAAVPTVMCAAVVLGAAGPVAAAASEGSGRAPAAATPQALIPGTAVLPGQDDPLKGVADAVLPVTGLLTNLLKAEEERAPAGTGGLTDVVRPVTGLLTNVLKADDGQISEAYKTEFSQTLQEALAESGTGSPDVRTSVPAPVGDESLAKLLKSVEELLKASTGGKPAEVLPAVTDVLTGVTDVLSATALGNGQTGATTPVSPAAPGLG